MQTAIVLSFTALVTASLPASPVVWLRPAELPRPRSRVNIWPNAVAGSSIAGATLDKTRCSLGGALCSSAPVVGVLSSGHRVVNFTGPGPNGLGNNLIVAGNYSALNASYSVFFASATAPGVAGQRILGKYREGEPRLSQSMRLLLSMLCAGSRDANWLIGSWWSAVDNVTYLDRACESCYSIESCACQ